MTTHASAPDGIFHDRLTRSSGEVRDFGWRHNIVVDRCRTLLAGFMRGDNATGVRALAVGQGDPAWDLQPPPPPGPGTQQLADGAAIQVAVTAADMAYLDAAGQTTAGPTARIQIRLTLDTTVLPPVAPATTYILREFGLFGRFGTDDYLIDYVRHPRIDLAPGDTLVRTIRLVF